MSSEKAVRRQRDESVFVAVESGAPWPWVLDACRRGHAGTAVVVQGSLEAPGKFARRCRAALGELEPGHHALAQAVVAVGSGLDVETRTARAAIAMRLLRRMAGEPGGVLIFALPSKAPIENQNELMALVQSLVEVASPRLSIRIVTTTQAWTPRNSAAMSCPSERLAEARTG